MPKVVVGRWRQETAFVPHCIVRISLVFYFSDKNEQNRSTVFEKLSLLIVHFQKRSKNGVQTLFWMIAQIPLYLPFFSIFMQPVFREKLLV